MWRILTVGSIIMIIMEVVSVDICSQYLAALMIKYLPRDHQMGPWNKISVHAMQWDFKENVVFIVTCNFFFIISVQMQKRRKKVHT